MVEAEEKEYHHFFERITWKVIWLHLVTLSGTKQRRKGRTRYEIEEKILFITLLSNNWRGWFVMPTKHCDQYSKVSA